MPEVVQAPAVESSQKLKAAIEEYFKTERYSEITRAIGMHSVLVDPNRANEVQKRLYRTVLDMIKNRIAARLGKQYSSWYSDFPALMDQIVTGARIVTDKSSARVLASQRAAFGPFKSVEDFYFWALTDRKLSLDQIVTYLEASSELKFR